MGFIEEAVRDFYKEKTFFSAAKKYQPELKKQIVEFLRKKGIKGFKGDYDFKANVDYETIGKEDARTRQAKFRKVLDSIEIRKDFFKAGSSYDAKMELPQFVYGDYLIEIEIQSNEDFFEDGHDVKVEINDAENPSYETRREFEDYKLNLLRKIDIVLEDLWKIVEKSIDRFENTEKEKKSYNYSSHRHTSNDIEKMISRWLNTYYKTYKSGKKKEIDDPEKQPAEFYVSMESPSNKYSSEGRGGLGFTLRFKVRKLSKNFTTSGSSYRSKTYINPEIKKRFPDYEDWIETYNAGVEAIGGDYREKINANNMFGEKAYGDEHLAVLDKLKFITQRLLKRGYYPDAASTPYKKGEFATITFKYDPALVEKVRKDPSLAKKFISSKRFKENVERPFFYEGESVENTKRRIIMRWFSTAKRLK